MNNIYLIVGESGSGKTTIADALCAEYGMSQVRSYTNRPPRSDDETSHSFIDTQVFPTFTEIERVFEDIVARTEFNGYCYFGTAAQVNEADLYVIDPSGIDYFRTHYRGAKGIRVIYVYASPEQRMMRMLGRGDTSDKVNDRMHNDEHVEGKAFFASFATADYVAYNTGDLRACVRAVVSYIQEEERA